MNKIYQKAKECLGRDMSAKFNEYGCAEACNAVFKLATGREIGGDVSTYRMYQSLLTDKDFKQVNEPEAGDLIIAPTGYGQGSGHVGIVGENNKIMSNNSYNSLWEENYTLFTWKIKYKSFPILFYRYKFMFTEEIKVNIEKQLSLYQRVVALLMSLTNKLK